MSTLLQRFCLLVAAMDLSSEDLKRLLSEIRTTSSSALFDEISVISEWQQANDIESRDDDIPKIHKSVPNLPSEAVHKIEFLLRQEAGLSMREAVDELAHAIVSDHPEHRKSALLQPINKKGLGEWLRRITRIVSERDLLHYATVIRNKYVHSTPSDWLPRR
jgi:hypothetical protein